MNIKTAFRLPVIFLIIAGLIGLLLRVSFFSFPFESFHYRFWVHAHSHVMLLGWLFNSAFLMVLYYLYGEQLPPILIRIFWLLQLSIVGMLFTFPVQGYAAGSIFFSTLHILVSYYFIWFVWPDLPLLHPVTSLLLKWSLLFLGISTIGPFALGAGMANGLEQSVFYSLSIYYYLHFQYNGWLMFAFLFVFFSWGIHRGHRINQSQAIRAIRILVIACFLTFSLSALWIKPGVWLNMLGFFSAVLQIISFFVLAGCFPWREVAPEGRFMRFVSGVLVMAFALKLLLQLFSSLPPAVEMTQIKNIVIAYLHLVFLGVFTVFIFWWLWQTKILAITSLSKSVFFLFMIGFAGTEFVLAFSQWMDLPWRNEIIFSFSFLLLLSFVLIGTCIFTEKNQTI